jgi:hypothetical protein
MSPLVAALAPVAPLLAGFADVFPIVLGVLLALCGLGLLLMGLIALADRAWRSGTVGALSGLVLLVSGLWLVGVF